VAPVHEDCPEIEASAPPPAPAHCAGRPVHDYRPDETSLGRPTELDGCPFTVSGLEQDQQLFFKLWRPTPDSLLKYSWNWGDAPSPRPRLALSFANIPYSTSTTGSCYQLGWTVDSAFGVSLYYGDAENHEDLYHCVEACACRTYCGQAADDGTPCEGSNSTMAHAGTFLYLTISARDVKAGAIVAGWLNLEWVSTSASIQAEQLAVLQDVYETLCWPTQQYLPVFTRGNFSLPQPNKHWTRQNHINGLYSSVKPSGAYFFAAQFNTTNGERDSDTVPFCDWMFRGTPQNSRERVRALTTSSCDQIDYVRCDADGNVIEMHLGYHALTGSLKPEWFERLPKLRELSFAYNQLHGPVPATIYTSEALVDLELQHNKFRGPLACPPHPEPKLSLLSLEVNEFSGGLPPCLFTSLPRLTSMDVSYNQLEGATLPPEIASSQHLTQLYAAASGLTGALPLQLKCMRRLTILSLANNDLGGEVAQPLIDGMTSLVTLDLQHNHFAGPIPHFDHAVNLRSIFLDHNSFSGQFDAQLSEFSNRQRLGFRTSVHLGYNLLSGPLPSVFHRMLTNAHSIYSLEVAGNHFRCDGETGDWPAWVWRIRSFSTGNPNRYRHSLGVCVRVPVISAVSSVRIDGSLVLRGSAFLPSEELKCKLCETGASEGCAVMPAIFINSTAIICTTRRALQCTEPCNAPSADVAEFGFGAEYAVTAANYGTDWFDEATHPETYPAASAAGRLRTVVDYPSPPPPTLPALLIENTTERDLTSGAIAGIVIGSLLVALGCFALLFFMVSRERRGMPLFRKAGSAARPIVVAQTSGVRLQVS